MSHDAIVIQAPEWVARVVDWGAPYATDEDRMRLAIALARENVEHGTGGPFGAVVVERDAGRLVAIGVNSVLRLNNSAMHAEVMALMFAQQRLRTYTLAAPGLPAHDLVTSCDPCAMCLGAALWSGVRRILCGAQREDAVRLAFDEGPVFPASLTYLEERGIEIRRGVLRDDACQVLERYAALGGAIYNA